MELASLAREAENGVRSVVLLQVRVLRMNGYLWMPPVLYRVSPSVFQSRRTVHADESATVRRLLLDRIEATIYPWTVSGDPTNAGMHAHVAAFPYLDVTKLVPGSDV